MRAWRLLYGILSAAVLSFAQAPPAYRMMRTPEGVNFAVIGEKPTRPAPIVFLFGLSLQETVADAQFEEIEKPLRQAGAIFATVDSPSHGAEQPKDDPKPLHDWRVRIERGDNFVEPFVRRVSRILDYLRDEGYADPTRVGAAGISRGGYLALQFAAAERRVRAVAAFAPVTNLLALREFAGAEDNALARSLSLLRFADRLAARPILITIGTTDYRVGTHESIIFFQRLLESAAAQGVSPGAQLRVVDSKGHHLEPEHYRAGAEWLSGKLK
jgi:dienelactone hydrolase